MKVITNSELLESRSGSSCSVSDTINFLVVEESDAGLDNPGGVSGLLELLLKYYTEFKIPAALSIIVLPALYSGLDTQVKDLILDSAHFHNSSFDFMDWIEGSWFYVKKP